MRDNFGIKRTCDNCAEACTDKLPAWKCKALFRPSEDALKNRIAELTSEVARLKAIKDIDELKKTFEGTNRTSCNDSAQSK